MDFEARSENGVGNGIFFGLKLGLDLEMRAAHNFTKNSKEYPPGTYLSPCQQLVINRTSWVIPPSKKVRNYVRVVKVNIKLFSITDHFGS